MVCNLSFPTFILSMASDFSYVEYPTCQTREMEWVQMGRPSVTDSVSFVCNICC